MTLPRFRQRLAERRHNRLRAAVRGIVALHAPVAPRAARVAPVPAIPRRKKALPEYGGHLHRIAKPKGRFAPKVPGKRGRTGGLVLKADHPAIVEGRPLFTHKIVAAADSPRLLVSGMNQRKIGRKVMKGRWKGLPIYTLTLPERSTCPSTCQQWRSCYGNGMPHARRHRLDDGLIALLEAELVAKAREHPRGFVVRIHILGDFGPLDDEPLSLRYVAMWERAFETLPQMRAFGFTAHDPDQEVGSALLGLNLAYPDRCRIRFSGTEDDEGFGSIVIENPEDSRHVLCPAQTDKTDCCGTCGLCWTMNRTIEFVRH